MNIDFVAYYVTLACIINPFAALKAHVKVDMQDYLCQRMFCKQ